MDLGEICLACGMCCRGVLYGEARLEDGEQEVMLRIGGRVTADGAAFELPCPAHDGDRCTTYDDRPKVCWDFECEVLRSVRRGDRTAGEALRLVASLRQKVAELEELVGGPETGLTLDERTARLRRRVARSDRRRNELTLKAIVLDIERAAFEPDGYRDPRMGSPASRSTGQPPTRRCVTDG